MATITGTALGILMIGSTHYVDIGKSEDAVIYYPDAVQRLHASAGHPADERLDDDGEDGYSVSWDDGPEGRWQISHEPGTFTYIGPDGEACRHDLDDRARRSRGLSLESNGGAGFVELRSSPWNGVPRASSGRTRLSSAVARLRGPNRRRTLPRPSSRRALLRRPPSEVSST